MDDNTFKLGIAIVSSVQVLVLAFLAYKSQQTSSRVKQTTEKVTTVHDLVNGQSNQLAKLQEARGFQSGVQAVAQAQHDPEPAAIAAARAQGELAGRDYERAVSAAIPAIPPLNPPEIHPPDENRK